MFFRKAYPLTASLGGSDMNMADHAEKSVEPSARSSEVAFQMIYYLTVSTVIFILALFAIVCTFCPGNDPIFFGSRGASFFHVDTPDAAMLYIASMYTLIGALSLLIWEFRVSRHKLEDSLAHRMFRLSILSSITLLACINASCYKNYFTLFAIRFVILLMLLTELIYHYLLTSHFYIIFDDSTGVQDENANVKMRQPNPYITVI
ncbi:hypothetical protein Ocin01_11204 [Orchesella cincta]|uniref:Uncharacterized protein n=1 Tax=Orchesella cincta TaxID=48709 RepID=A0A1D2MQX2_ORCCI|nr:hypothetical protein Ocin01_11204 [Orchesella cincta]